MFLGAYVDMNEGAMRLAWGRDHGPRIHHQPEAQHPKSSAIHKLPADYPIYWGYSGHWFRLALHGSVANDLKRTFGRLDSPMSNGLPRSGNVLDS